MPNKTIYSIVIAAALSPLFCQDFFPSAYPFSGSDIVWQPGTRERASEQTYVEVHSYPGSTTSQLPSLLEPQFLHLGRHLLLQYHRLFVSLK